MTQKEKEYILLKFDPQFNESIKWLFERQNIDGVFPAYFILYSYKHNLPITINKISFEYIAGNDALQDQLYNASLLMLGGDSSKFTRLTKTYELIKSLNKKLFDEIYFYLLDSILCSTELVAGTHLQPNSRIAYTIAKILEENKCKSVYGGFSGIGIFALACKNMIYTGAEPYAPANLIAKVLCDALYIENANFTTENPLNLWPKEKFDAIIGNLPVDVDFFNLYRADHFLHEYNQKQDQFITKLIKNKTAKKVAALLIHFEFANYATYDNTRKLICNKGLLKTVIALPENIFRESIVPTYIMILDMEGGHTEAEFIDAHMSMIRQKAYMYTYKSNLFDIRECIKQHERVIVSYKQIENASWSFNPSVYIQDAKANAGQELVKIGDLASIEYGEMDVKERHIEYSNLSESFSKAAISITPSVPTKDWGTKLVKGPSVLIALTSGQRNYSQKLKCGIYKENGTYSVDFFIPVLKPDPNKILPEYLALALMTDPSFTDYFKSIQEYYTDEVRSTHLLERKIPIYTDLATQKKAVIDALGRADMAERSYNIIIAGAGNNLRHYRNIFMKHGCNILASTETVEGPDGLENILKHITKEKTAVSRKAEAVVFATDILLTGENIEEKFSGLDAILDLKLKYGNSGLKFFAASNYTIDNILESGFISPRRIKSITDCHFFMNDNGKPSDALAASVRESLDQDLSPSARIRSKHKLAFEAAEWLDSTYANKEIQATETISEFLMAAEEGIDTTRRLSDLRNVAHRIIEILQECRAVPVLDNGAIPHLLYDKKYKNNKDGKTYIQNIEIMRRSLSSSLISLIEVGNEGTHTFKTSANLGTSMLQTLLEFLTWFYDNKELFSKELIGYWQQDNKYELTWTEVEGPAKLHIINGSEHWTCLDVHLYVPESTDIQEGDIVTVRKRLKDTGKIKIESAPFFAFPKGYNNQNPDGYTIDISRRV